MKKSTVKVLLVLIGILSTIVFTDNVHAQVAKTQVVQLQAKANIDGSIQIEWPKETFNGNYVIYKRDPSMTLGTWSTAIATIDPSNNYYVDKTTKIGEEREYLVAKVENSKTSALGYIQTGNKTKPTVNRGGIILLIDSAYRYALSTEIQQLKNDLTASGWMPFELFAGRNEQASAVKDRISKFMDSKVERPKTLYILGHVPVPYSGFFSSTGDRPPPDGHVEGSGNHTGAWPADVFYGDFAGVYTDRSVNCTTGSDSRNHNIPKDGKFDQSSTYENIELEIGRVDFYNMPLFGGNDTQLTREYLNRVHNWRMAKVPFVKRALIDNNFTSLNLASTGYQNLPTFVGIDSVFDSRDYFTAQTQGNYLWSYGCGAGSYTSCSGIGSSNDFLNNKSSFSNIFTLLAGSFFGDWDSKNNLMRSSLAAGSLACAWGGIPKWYLHHMAIGYNIGYGARLTQNNFQGYFDGSFNGSGRGVHIALLGDPTLTMIPVAPVTNVNATSENGSVKLTWNKAYGKVDGYYIYLFDKATGKFTLASEIRCPNTPSFTTDTFFRDNCNWSSGNYSYAVRAMSITETGSGTYENLSLAAFADVAHTNNQEELSITTLSVYPNPVTDCIFIHGIIDATIEKVNLMSMNGKIVYSAKIEQLKSENTGTTLKIPVKNINAGIFNLEIIQSDRRTNFKVIIP
jgi:hypothetical protein